MKGRHILQLQLVKAKVQYRTEDRHTFEFFLFCFLVCLLDFEVIEGRVIVDQSGKGNNAYLDKSAVVRPHDQMCGHYADLTGDGDIILVDKTFRGKPQTGVTIACWVNLQGNLAARHSLFSTVRMMSPVNFIGV